MSSPAVPAPDEAALPELIRHIVDAHHRYCRREMPRIAALFPPAVAAAAGRPELPRLASAFQRLCGALTQHLGKEETVLFPLIAEYDDAAHGRRPAPTPSFGSIASPIRMMMLEHDEAEAVLARMRQDTGGFQPPPESPAAVQELYAALRAFDDDMRRHVELEDRHLFPRALAVEQAALAR